MPRGGPDLSKSQMDAAIAAAVPALNPFLVVPQFAVAGGSNGTVTQNAVYLYRLPRVIEAKTLTKVAWCNGGTVHGNSAAALMTTTDPVETTAQALAATFARQATTGEVANAGASGWQIANLGAAHLYLPDTDLWVAIGTDSATHTYYRTTLPFASIPLHGLWLSEAGAYSSGIPASIVTPAAGIANGIVVMVY